MSEYLNNHNLKDEIVVLLLKNDFDWKKLHSFYLFNIRRQVVAKMADERFAIMAVKMKRAQIKDRVQLGKVPTVVLREIISKYL